MKLSAIQVSCCLCEVKVLSIKALSNPNLRVKERTDYILESRPVKFFVVVFFFAAVKP